MLKFVCRSSWMITQRRYLFRVELLITTDGLIGTHCTRRHCTKCTNVNFVHAHKIFFIVWHNLLYVSDMQIRIMKELCISCFFLAGAFHLPPPCTGVLNYLVRHRYVSTLTDFKVFRGYNSCHCPDWYFRVNFPYFLAKPAITNVCQHIILIW